MKNMKILIHETTLSGEPIPESGWVAEGETAEEIIEVMRYQTPFSATLDTEDYMRQVLADLPGNDKPLPKDDSAPNHFLMRLAQTGMIEFLPDKSTVKPVLTEEDKPCVDK